MNITGTDQDIKNQKDVIDSDFSRVPPKSLVNFGPLKTKL